MASTHEHDDAMKEMLEAIARSTARVRKMADEARALVEQLQRRPAETPVKQLLDGIGEGPSPGGLPKKKKG